MSSTTISPFVCAPSSKNNKCATQTNIRVVSRGDCDLNALKSVLPRFTHQMSRPQESCAIWMENVEREGVIDSNVSGSIRSEDTLLIQ
mmetsp:Transcript_22057/g.46536  ORF Transcript_22057/g.46536 Transcript_22057/m.46536 type:complete len:88 (-) Transcript_22057:677-940(-)